jgi:membrane protein YdbS with pleckstrin-like domain
MNEPSTSTSTSNPASPRAGARGPVAGAGRWIYRGVWGVLVRWFSVPPDPPTLPAAAGDAPSSFRPAPGFLRYLKLGFWIWLVIINGGILIAWLAITLTAPTAGAVLLLPALLLALVPDIVFYIALHLRYDTTWYVMTQRSLRIRRGIWVLHETTITFENVQNIKIMQGPIQRYFGIADVLVETAGG